MTRNAPPPVHSVTTARKWGVHSTEMIVWDAVGDGHRVVAVLAGWFAKDLAELGALVLGVP